eukprot:760655-Hanusia_phi.AAC.2
MSHSFGAGSTLANRIRDHYLQQVCLLLSNVPPSPPLFLSPSPPLSSSSPFLHAISSPFLLSFLSAYRSSQILLVISRVVGSTNVLGNPLGLVNALSSGVVDLFKQPAKELKVRNLLLLPLPTPILSAYVSSALPLPIPLHSLLLNPTFTFSLLHLFSLFHLISCNLLMGPAQSGRSKRAGGGSYLHVGVDLMRGLMRGGGSLVWHSIQVSFVSSPPLLPSLPPPPPPPPPLA